MLIDSHCHLTDGRFDGDRAGVLATAGAAGVTGLVTVASDAADSRAVAELVAARSSPEPGVPRVWGTAGIHPHEAAACRPGDLELVRDLAQSNPGIVAIGETGLDFHYDHSPRDAQRRRFEEQIELAGALDLPVVVHTRSADAEAIAMLQTMPPGIVGVLHCFTGGADLLDAGLEAGWYVSFSGIVSFKNYDGADLVRRVPRDRLLVETDAPYLAPVPYRGKRNEPAWVAHVAEAVSVHRGEDPDEVAAYTALNAARFYGFDAGSGGT